LKYATDIRLRAEIKAGELLAEMRERGERQKAGDASARWSNGSMPQPLLPSFPISVSARLNPHGGSVAAMVGTF
jgi:hypothetical protein